MCLDFGKGTSLLVGSVYNDFFFSHAISRKIVQHFLIYSVEIDRIFDTENNRKYVFYTCLYQYVPVPLILLCKYLKRFDK